jgi:hypothetical protein
MVLTRDLEYVQQAHMSKQFAYFQHMIGVVLEFVERFGQQIVMIRCTIGSYAIEQRGILILSEQIVGQLHCVGLQDFLQYLAIVENAFARSECSIQLV